MSPPPPLVTAYINRAICQTVIRPSGAGKSSLARALIGAWRPARGTIRFDGASLDQWDAEDFGGYLPQSVELLDGTIAENIARFDPTASSEAVLAAAKAAAAHDMITRLPQGYDTRVALMAKPCPVASASASALRAHYMATPSSYCWTSPTPI